MSPTRPPPLILLETFQRVARHQSLKLAAAEIGVTASAVSHRMRALEVQVGATLFERLPRQIRLTAAGRRLAKRLAPGFAAIDAAWVEAYAVSLDHRLKVSTLPLFASAWLIPRLDAFAARHPEIGLEIETTNRVVDLAPGIADVAIRNVPKPGGDLRARKLLDLRGVLLCHAAIAARLRSPEDLATTTLIHLSVGQDLWTRWFAAAGITAAVPKARLSVDTLPAAIEAAVAGHGVMLGLAPLIFDAPAAAPLVAPFDGPTPTAGAYYVVHRREDSARASVRAFVDWLTETMRHDQRRLARRAATVTSGARPRTRGAS